MADLGVGQKLKCKYEQRFREDQYSLRDLEDCAEASIRQTILKSV